MESGSFGAHGGPFGAHGGSFGAHGGPSSHQVHLHQGHHCWLKQCEVHSARCQIDGPSYGKLSSC